jgi:hypothetical protein
MSEFCVFPLVAEMQRKTRESKGESMRKHVSNGRPIGLGAVVRPASGGNANGFTLVCIDVDPAVIGTRAHSTPGSRHSAAARNA